MIIKALIFLVCLIPVQVHAFERYNRITKYDPYFSKYSKRYFGPNFEWRHFKSQAIAESRLKENASSRVGARGLMQIMPRTFEEIKKRHPVIKGSREQPRWNIAAGIYYDRVLWKGWKTERPFQDRLNFTFGAYNAGKRNIIKAQRIAQKKGMNPNLWSSIESVLPETTGKHSKETIEYIRKIYNIKGVLK